MSKRSAGVLSRSTSGKSVAKKSSSRQGSPLPQITSLTKEGLGYLKKYGVIPTTTAANV
jgi:hypothetical protein